MMKKIAFVFISTIFSWHLSHPMKKNQLQYNKKQHCACSKDPQSLHEASLNLCKYHCEFFLEKRENLNLLTTYTTQGIRVSTTPLDYPILCGKKKIVTLFLDNGAQVNTIGLNNGKNHHTALFVAALRGKKFFKWFLETLTIKYKAFIKEHGTKGTLPFFANNVTAHEFYSTIHHELVERKDAFDRTAHSIMKKKSKKIFKQFLESKNYDI